MYIDYNKQIPVSFKNKVRGFARNVALDLLSLSNNSQVLCKPRIQFLYFHHVFKNEEAKLHLLLKYLSKQHTFISYSSAIEKLETGEIDKPYICFSSDDGFKNNLRSAAIFKDFGVSACYFICPSMIGKKNYDEIKFFCSTNLHIPPIEFLNWDDIEAMQKIGHEIGSHTMNHFRISTLSNNQIDYELEVSKEIIEIKTGLSNMHFAYPYGLQKDINEYAIKKVHQLGYKSCASAQRGIHLSKIKIADTLIKRDQVVFDWRLKHIEHFLLKNCK